MRALDELSGTPLFKVREQSFFPSTVGFPDLSQRFRTLFFDSGVATSEISSFQHEIRPRVLLTPPID